MFKYMECHLTLAYGVKTVEYRFNLFHAQIILLVYSLVVISFIFKQPLN